MDKQAKQDRFTTASSSKLESGIYPPPSASLAFPDDPFSDPHKRTPAQKVHQPLAPTPDALSEWAKQTRFTVLNHFSQVTNVARNGAHTLLSSPLFQQQQQLLDHDAKHRTSGVSLATSLLQHGPVGPFGPSDPDWKHSELAQKSGTGDFDSAHVYLARWAKIVAEEGEANRRKEAEARRAVHKAAMDVEESELGSFEVWDRLPHIERPEPTRSRDNAISRTAWRSLFDDQGRPRITRLEMKALVFQQGFGKGKERMTGTHWDQLDPRAECWSFLLGAQTWQATVGRDQRRAQWNDRAEQYWTIKTQYLANCTSERRNLTVSETDAKTAPEDEHDAHFWREQQHRVRVDCLRVDRKLPFFEDHDGLNGGADTDGKSDPTQRVNAHAQRLEEILLSYVAWDRARETAAAEEEEETDERAADETTSQTTEQRERGLLGGYVQGMSDLCAPLYAVCHGDEAKTFWLLVGVMQRARSNFYSDQSGMKRQLTCLQKLLSVMDANLHAHLERTDGLNLFFCFRWLLVCFKREFDFPDILMLWEAVWAAELDQDESGTQSQSHAKITLSNSFQIFVALAILEQQRDVVVKYLQHFDEILQYMNGLSGQIDVDVTIAEAQVLCLSLRNLVLQHDEGRREVNGVSNGTLAAEGASAEPQEAKQASSAEQAAALAAAASISIDDDLRSLVGAVQGE